MNLFCKIHIIHKFFVPDFNKLSYKRTKIIGVLKEYGFKYLREGSNHTIFTNGHIKVPVGRHKEISTKTAQRIAKEINVPWTEFMSQIC